jgi:hypothetical protein
MPKKHEEKTLKPRNPNPRSEGDKRNVGPEDHN